MGDIVKIFSQIGKIYLKDEKKVRNRAYEYEKIKVYLCDVETKAIEPHENIQEDELIICRFGVGANSGNLFPNQPFFSKEVKNNIEKFAKGTIKANQNLLSYFTEDEIEQNEILKLILGINEDFFISIHDELKVLEEYKEKGKKTATYFSLSFQGKPISAYFEDIYEKHISKKEKSQIYGYDILTNEVGIGGDASLAFCSVNELPKKFQAVKPRLLPMSSESAKYIKTGFTVVKTRLAYNFFGLKLAVMPTILSEDETILPKVLRIIEEASKKSIDELGQTEFFINLNLEIMAQKQAKLPVLNTILFYNQNNAAIDLLLQIDDVLPSFISHIANTMSKHFIKAYSDKSNSGGKDFIYLQNLFLSKVEIMDFLLSGKKAHIEKIVEKYAQLIYGGNVDKRYTYPLDWIKYFNNYYKNRSIEAIKRYQDFFNEIDVVNKKLMLQKEFSMQEVKDIKDSKERVKFVYKKSEFIHANEVLQSAYLLGMISAALINWQMGINQGRGSAYGNWLNNSGAITQDSLERVWKKVSETKRKLQGASGRANKTVTCIKDLLLEVLPKAFLHKEVQKSAYVTLSFAMGGSDYDKYIKEKRDKKGDEDA